MADQISGFSLPGFRVGHWTHESGRTGCSIVIPDEPALAVVDIRGGAPGTRETSLLDEGRMVQHVNAVLLTGGSAFGLSAADGVMQWLREQGKGFQTASIPVPIVSAAVLYDLKGEEPIWPNAEAGYLCAQAATDDGWVSGRHGAGAGATVAKVVNRDGRPSGIGAARIETSAGTVAALLAVNAVGEVAVDRTGRRNDVRRGHPTRSRPSREIGRKHDDRRDRHRRRSGTRRPRPNRGRGARWACPRHSSGSHPVRRRHDFRPESPRRQVAAARIVSAQRCHAACRHARRSQFCGPSAREVAPRSDRASR